MDETKKHGRKRFYIKSYNHLWQLEEAVRGIRARAPEGLQMSLLGKLAQTCALNEDKLLEARKELNHFWKGVTGLRSDLKFFCNPEMGTLFIIGAVATQFLHNMGGKALGEIASGPYGILRGLGIDEGHVCSCLKDLNEKCYLLILRGYEHELMALEALI